jgi:hypothetical protein
MINMRTFQLIVLLFGIVGSAGCHRLEKISKGATETININGSEVYLLSKEMARPVHAERITVIGHISKDELNCVLRLVGRIPQIQLTPEKIWVAWDENPVAVKIAIKGYCIYCTRESSRGDWTIQDVCAVVH